MASFTRKALTVAEPRRSRIQAVLDALERSFPHLEFSKWSSRKAINEEPTSWVKRKGADLKTITVSIGVDQRELRCTVTNHGQTVPNPDYVLIAGMAKEAIRLIAHAEHGEISLLGFGTESVADLIQNLGSLNYPFLDTLRFISSLSSQTYENQRLSYGLVLTKKTPGPRNLSECFANKRFKNMTDGFSTALVLGKNGTVCELSALEPPRDEGLHTVKRPWWVAGLAEKAHGLDGIGVSLTRNGDVLILFKRKLFLTQRNGIWTRWHHPSILKALFSLWVFRGTAKYIKDVLSYCYSVALDLSFRRSGGLIVISSTRDISKLVPGSSDRIGERARKGPEVAIDRALSGRRISKTDRRVSADLASMDGALVLDRNGSLLAWGAMTKSSKASSQGARTRAARGAIQHGIAIKISSDGDITFYSGGKLRMTL